MPTDVATVRISEGWTLLGTAAGAVRSPGDLPADGWRPAMVPGTVAQALGLTAEAAGVDIDAMDWWYRGNLAAEGRSTLRFDGLATIADVWLNGQLILQSRNMHRIHEVAVDGGGALVLCFRSVTAALATKKPRPRWRTALVANQNLRWLRTSLVGRIPGWTPPIPAVGPWRGVSVRTPASPAMLEIAEGVSVHSGGVTRAVAMPDAARPAFHVDGQRIFARGACWTVADVCTFDDPPPGVTRESMRLARDAGLNMLRVGGTMTWASEELLDACDEFDILVWQDLMFANMDYPFDDAEFRSDVTAEIAGQIARLRRHRCVVVYCGGSEVEQQAAMMGQPRLPGDVGWASAFYTDTLPALIAEHHPGAVYVPNTPTGGALPFHTSTGFTHYYGVGAYQRPLADARAANVAFTPECLGFSNVPEPDHVERHFGSASPATHLPAWKAGVPRDNGAGWDFEDVRDHYLRVLFGLDPVALRYSDLERYHAISRIVTGELMLRTYAEWRRPGSGCGGALVWFWKDLRPGAGWGVLDSENRPKPCYWYLKRAWAPRAVLLTDEGLNGVDIHVINDGTGPLEGTVELELCGGGAGHGPRIWRQAVVVPPRSALTLSGEAMIGSFSDLAWAYRFGPPRHDVVVARLCVHDELIHGDALFPVTHSLATVPATCLSAELSPSPTGHTLTLRGTAFLQSVAVVCPGYEPDDNYVHLTPDRPRTLTLRPIPGLPVKPLRGWITALNLQGGVAVRG